MSVRAITPQQHDNFRNLYRDVFWFGVLAGSTMGFIAIYATRLGASSLQISLLTAGPAAFNLIFSLPMGQWLVGRSLASAAFWSAVLQRLGFVLLIPLPLLTGDQFQVWVIVLFTLVMAIPGTLLAISFNALLAEVVPPDWRAEVVGKRNAIVAVSLTTSTLLSGQILVRIVFPYNYMIVYVIGAIGAALSTYYLGRINLNGSLAWHIERPSGGWLRSILESIHNVFRFRKADPSPQGKRLTRANFQKLLHLDLLRSPFGFFMLSYLLFYTFQYLGIPLFPIYQVRVLNLSDSVISLGNGLFYAAMFLLSIRIMEISTRLGHRRVLISGAIIFFSYPLLLGLAQGPGLFWVASLMGGGAWALTNAGLTNRLMERVPEQQRPAGMTLHNLALNLGILAGSLGAPLAANRFGLQPSLFLDAGLRLLAGILFIFWA